MTIDDFIRLKETVKQMQNEIADLKAEIHDRDGIKTTLIQVHTTQKMMMWSMPLVFSFLVAAIQIILQVVQLP